MKIEYTEIQTAAVALALLMSAAPGCTQAPPAGSQTTPQSTTLSREDYEKAMSAGGAVPSEVASGPSKKEPHAVGTSAPDFEALAVDGKTIRLSDYRGKVVVLDFWATWCVPCIASLPNLEETAQRTKGQDVVFLAMNVMDAKSEFDRWMRINSGLTLQFARDPAGEPGQIEGIAALYHLTGIPSTFVIDRDGRIAGAPQAEVTETSSAGKKNQPIPTTGKPDKELVEVLGGLGIGVK